MLPKKLLAIVTVEMTNVAKKRRVSAVKNLVAANKF